MTTHIKSLRIEKIVTGGYGLGHSPEGKVVLVLGVLADEQVDVQIFKSKKSYDLGFITALVTPSPLRIEPLCSLVGQCGGCTFQHIAYPDQVRIKQDVFCEDWKRYFKERVPLPEVEFVEAADPFHYRQRIRLHLEDGVHSFYRHHSSKPVEVTSCPLAQSAINDCLQELESCTAYQDLTDYLTDVIIHDIPDSGNCALELYFKRKLRPADQKRIASLITLAQIQTIRVYGVSAELLLVVGKPQQIKFAMVNKHGSFVFEHVPGDFCQINMAQNQEMLRFVMDRIDHSTPSRILDLFCGLGNFSVPLAGLGHDVTGIEIKRSSIRSAEKNSRANKATAIFLRMSAREGVEQELANGAQYDVIILDPPRAGFKKGAELLAGLTPKKIFYIACNQQTQMRDVEMMISKGYHVTEVCLVDMFPQTHHLESIVVLEAL